MNLTAMPYPLRDYLAFLGACQDALEWAEDYGNNWQKAWQECTDFSWMMFAIEAGHTDDPGFVPQEPGIFQQAAYTRLKELNRDLYLCGVMHGSRSAALCNLLRLIYPSVPLRMVHPKFLTEPQPVPTEGPCSPP